MENKITIKKMLPKHWVEVSKIYMDGIQSGMATFEKEIPAWKVWDGNHLKECRIIAVLNKKIVGWAALSPVSSRCVYGGVGEVSVYVSTGFRGIQIGEILLRKLIIESEKNGLWTIQSGIFTENIGSIKLHEKVGFRKIGFREKIGEIDGVWKDNLLLERRSKLIGIK
jgi:phosphinothricin acetyltransferase